MSHNRNERKKVESKYKPQRLEWKLDQVALTQIECASASVSKLIHASDLQVMLFNHLGNSFLKRYKMTPDFFVQIAIQLAYYKMYKTLPAVSKQLILVYFITDVLKQFAHCLLNLWHFVKPLNHKQLLYVLFLYHSSDWYSKYIIRLVKNGMQWY